MIAEHNRERTGILTGTMTDQRDDYLRSTRDDIALLPVSLAREARVVDRGQAEWPPTQAEAAIRALIGLGRVVNVLECARYVDGILIGCDPITTYEGDGPEANLQWILPGVDQLAEGTTAVVSWYPA